MSDTNRPTFGVSSPKVHCTWMEVRGASPDDPGEIALVHYIIDGSVLLLTDEQGQPRKNEGGAMPRVEIGPGGDPVALARHLARLASRRDRVHRERPLLYEWVMIV